MDRYKTNISTSQIGFIDTFVRPSFESLYILLPKLEENMKLLDKNKENWLQMKEYYDHNLKEIEKKINEGNKI
jgi:hypothetical protein